MVQIGPRPKPSPVPRYCPTRGDSPSDVIIKPTVDAKDIIFQQADGTSILEINDGAYAKFTAAAVAPEASPIVLLPPNVTFETD